MTLLVTGAAGYVGAAVVAAAQRQGTHVVRGLTRAQADLAAGDLIPHLQGVDVVIHCAAALRGDDRVQARDTVLATQRLVAALQAVTPRPRLILVSSMAVYAGDLPPGTLIDESTALEPHAHQRDAYTRAKLAQEAVVSTSGLDHCIARVGAVWGPGHLRNAHLGLTLGPVLIRLGNGPELPLAHVDNVAAALLRLAEHGHGPVNVLDDDRPGPALFVARLRQGGWPRVVLPLSWRLPDLLSLLPLPGKPGLLRRPALRARMAPRRYSNARLHASGWHPVIGFEAGMQAALAGLR